MALTDTLKETFAGNNAGEELRTAGTAFADSMRALPIGDMVSNIAVGVATAQAQLDSSSIKLLQAYAEPQVKMWGNSDETVSMLALGLVPSFFTFNRVNIKIVMELSFHEEQSNQGSLSLSGDKSTETPPADQPAGQTPAPTKSSFAAGGAVSVSSARKFAIDMSGLAEVNAEMISVPMPTAILEAITKKLAAN